MTDDAKGQSLKLFFIDGKPEGMLTAELFNWTGHVLAAPRTQLAEMLKRKEVSYTGVYFLFGEDESGSLAYIGEGEDISYRIRSHDLKKDWWTTAVLVTSAANSLNKAHAKYLEARLIEDVRAIGKIRLENGNSPARPSLSEADCADMEAFLENIKIILPAIRIDCFINNTRSLSTKQKQEDKEQEIPTFELKTPKHGIHATAKLMGSDFVVLKGSKARKAWEGRGSENSSYGQLYNELVTLRVLQESGENRVFTENYAFASPSAAGAVVNGRPTNGTMEWKFLGSNKTYKQWEEEELRGKNGSKATALSEA